MKKDSLSEKMEDESQYSEIIKDLYLKLYKKDIVIVLLIAQFYIKNMHDYIPICFKGLNIPILTEGFVGPISFNKTISSMFINSDGINKREVDKLFMNKYSQIFDICDFWLSFDIHSFDKNHFLNEDHPVFWEISALNDCSNMKNIELLETTPLQKYFLTKQIPLLLSDKSVLTEVEDLDLITQYAELTENEFLKYFVEKNNVSDDREKTNLKLILSLIPIMEVLDHAEEDFQHNQHFITLLSHGISFLIEYLKHGEYIDILNIHNILSSKFMKSNYTLVTVLEMCKSILILHNMEQVDNINFEKFTTFLPLSFYKEILPNLPTLTKHDIWNSKTKYHNIVSSSVKFESINFCIFLLQRLIQITLDCYNNLEVDMDVNTKLHQVLAKMRFLEIYYFKQLSFLTSEASSGSLGCYEHIFVDAHRRILYLNSVELQLTYFDNWSIEYTSNLSTNIEHFVRFFIFDIWDDYPQLKLLTQTLVAEMYLSDLMSRNKSLNTYLRQDINFKTLSNNKQSNPQCNVGISKLIKTLVHDEENLEKVDELLEEMKTRHLAIAKTTQRLALKPMNGNIYTTPEKSNHIASPKSKAISINDLKLKTENLDIDDIAPQSAIIHPL
ncbi:hypothetical protein ACO0R3_002638 [Hanseniaspora guilliermondii]